MTTNAIHPRLTEVLETNVGNKLTSELSAGLAGTLQQLLTSIAQEAYAAGQTAEREKGDAQDAAVVTDVEARES